MDMLGHKHERPEIEPMDGSRAVDGIGKELT